LTAGDAIEVDIRTGRVIGASPREWLALRLIRIAITLMQPFYLYGFSYVCRLVRTVLPSRRKIVFILADDCRMLTDYCDAYWSVLLQPGFPYETENANLVAAMRDVDYGFIDGGANHGFWSVLLTGKDAGRKPVVAIEAASDTYERLALNNALNGNRFVALNRAIGATSGEHVLIYGAKHEMRSTVAPDADAKPILDCITIALDDVARDPAFAGQSKFIVKLDVEGVEIAAMNAATGLLASDTVFLYEDHGSDRNHETTRHVLGELGMHVFWLGRHTPARRITDAAQLDAIKASHRFGYDFAASKSPFWIERISALMAEGGRPHSNTAPQGIAA
jgi:FkbM family methyltransferase